MHWTCLCQICREFRVVGFDGTIVSVSNSRTQAGPCTRLGRKCFNSRVPMVLNDQLACIRTGRVVELLWKLLMDGHGLLKKFREFCTCRTSNSIDVWEFPVLLSPQPRSRVSCQKKICLRCLKWWSMRTHHRPRPCQTSLRSSHQRILMLLLE